MLYIPLCVYLIYDVADAGGDDMKKLEERAKAIAEEAKQDQPKVGKRDILFIRYIIACIRDLFRIMRLSANFFLQLTVETLVSLCLIFRRGDSTQEELKEAVQASNPEEIDIDDDDDDDAAMAAPGTTVI